MLENILKLDGAQELTKNSQKNIKGGDPLFPIEEFCMIATLVDGEIVMVCGPCE